MAATRAASGPMIGALSRRRTASGAAVRTVVIRLLQSGAGAGRSNRAGPDVASRQPQQFCRPQAVSLESRPGSGLSVMSCAPVLLKPDGFLLSLANVTTARTPSCAILFGYCMTVAGYLPSLTFVTA